jgi:hypothetical protein
MPASLFDCIVGRTSERLVQGLLRFLLENDDDFRAAFQDWCGWPTIKEVREEECDGCHRHDLVLYLDRPNEKRNVELKLWAGLTNSQATDSASIDLFIVPKRYSGNVPKEKTRTWESFQEKVVSKSDFAQKLMKGFEQYTWTGGSLEISRLKEEILAWVGGREMSWKGSWFLTGCNECIENHGLKLGMSSSNKFYKDKNGVHGYWGYYLTLPEHRSTDRWLWNGFIFKGNAGEITECGFILQIAEALKSKLEIHTFIPSWYGREKGSQCICFSCDDPIFTVDNWWREAEDLLHRYETLNDRSI